MHIKKYHVFVSSTYVDLQAERDAVIRAILRLEHIPIGMEMFNAGNARQWELIKRAIDDSDYYVLLVGFRYGSTVGAGGLSYTEREYNYAQRKGVPVLGFIQDREAAVPSSKRETDPAKSVRLGRFIEKVSRRECAFWSDKNELSYLVSAALSQEFRSSPGTGWIRADYEAIQGELSALHNGGHEASPGITRPDLRDVVPINFYSQERRPPEYSFTNLTKDAVEIRVMTRTGVTLLAGYERHLDALLANGCTLKYLLVRDESAGMLQGHDDPGMHRENYRKTEQHLRRLASAQPGTVQCRTTHFPPTASVVYVRNSSGEELAIVQMYFVMSRVGKDRPMFVLTADNPWYASFKDELDGLWALGQPLFAE